MQKAIQSLVGNAIAEGSEGAVQVAVFLDGKCVVDVAAAPPSLKLDQDSLIPFFSIGKGFAATAVHRLAERGVLSLDTPIAEYWPEFAANGKANILVRQALNHTAGLPMLPKSPDEASPCDWPAMCHWLEQQPPQQTPGTIQQYHAVTYSWLVGETASRADGRPFAQIIREEVLAPLGIDNVYFGVPENKLDHCLDAEERPAQKGQEPPANPDPIAERAIPAWIKPLDHWINREEVRRACIPASNGYGTAQGIARHYAALLSNGLNGVRLLSDETIDAATRWAPETEAFTPGNGRWGLGYALNGPAETPGVRFGHGGYGGSAGFADKRYGLAVGIVRTRLGGDLTKAIIEIIEANVR